MNRLLLGTALAFLLLPRAHAAELAPDTTAPALITLDAEQVQRYANVHFLGSEAVPRPIAVMPIQNVSARVADAELVSAGASTTRISSGGIPLPALQSLLQQQLFGSGRFSAQADAPWRLRVLVRVYEPELPLAGGAILPGFLRNWWATLASSISTESAQALVVFDVLLDDRERGQNLLNVSVRARLPTCQTVPGPRPLTGEWQAADRNQRAFISRYHQTAIGQAALAAINALVVELHDNYAGSERVGRIIGRSAERLQLNLNERDVQVGDSVPVVHKERGTVLGHLQIAKVTEQFAFAYPVDIHSGSLAIGDRVMVTRANASAAIFLPVETRDSCPVAGSELAGEPTVHRVGPRNLTKYGEPTS